MKLLWSLFFCSILLASLVSAAEIDPEIVQALEEQNNVSVIVILKDVSEHPAASQEEKEIKKEIIRKRQEQVLETLDNQNEPKTILANLLGNSPETPDFEVEHRFTYLNGFSGEVTKDGLEKLEDNPLVESVYIEEVKHIFLSDSIPLINANDVWNLSVNGVSINGTGETVCVIDTGVNYNHTALGSGWGNKVIGGYDYYNDDSNPWDDHGHGTHVAGIIASTNDTYRGVAPGADIIAMKVCSASGSCPDADVLAGIEWCVDNATVFNISVISISLGGNQYTSYCDNNTPTDQNYAVLINEAVGNNISVMIATGNTNVWYPTATAGIAGPACIQNATRVTATTKSDVIASYAFRHVNFTDVLAAPGSSITSSYNNGGFTSLSGTSMATPHVSGTAALLHQYWRLAYSQTPTAGQIRAKLALTGRSVNDSGNTDMIFPRIDVLRAIQPFLNFTANNPTNGAATTLTSVIVNVTSDVALSAALLEWNNGTKINYTMNQSSSTNFYFNISGLASGNHSYTVYGNDSANTFGASEVRTLIVDNSPPNITINVPRNNSFYRQWLILNISLSNLQLSYSNYSLRNSSGTILQSSVNASISTGDFTWSDLINLSNTTFSDGNYTINVYCNDSRGNYAASNVTFVLDKTFPLFFAVNHTPEIVYNNDTVYFTVNVTDLYLNTTAVLLESNFSGSWENYTLNLEAGDKFNLTVTGANNLTNQKMILYRWIAGDYAGNSNSTEWYNFTVQNRAPTDLNITSPDSGNVFELGASINFRSTASDPDNDSLTYRWSLSNGTLFGTGQNVTLSMNNTGNFTIFLNVSDSFNFSLTNVSVFINDTLLPTIINLSYDSEVHLQQDLNQTVTASVFDLSGISSLKLYFNNTLQNSSCLNTSTTSSCSWEWGNLAVGSYNFSINFTDNFTTVHSNSSNYNFTVTSCSDSSQNGDETGTDCGGSCSACSSSSSSGSSGGGGGGGSAAPVAVAAVTVPASTPAPTPTPTSESSLSTGESRTSTSPPPATVPQEGAFSKEITLTNNQPTVVDATGSGTVTELKLSSNKEQTVKISIKTFSEKPSEAPLIENVYQYLEIDVPLATEEIESAEIKFTVPLTWFAENSYSTKKVILYTLQEGKWDALKTELLSTNSQDAIYAAQIKHFSIFAITAEKASVMEINYKIGLSILTIFIAIGLIIWLMRRPEQEEL